MLTKCVGFIETAGLAAGITAADTAAKSANVKIIGREFAKGDGMTTIKIEGDVGAVKAALMSAQVAASQVGRVVSVDVIPRPAVGLEMLVCTKDTIGLNESDRPVSPKPAAKKAAPVKKESEEKKPEEAPPAASAGEAENTENAESGMPAKKTTRKSKKEGNE